MISDRKTSAQTALHFATLALDNAIKQHTDTMNSLPLEDRRTFTTRDERLKIQHAEHREYGIPPAFMIEACHDAVAEIWGGSLQVISDGINHAHATSEMFNQYPPDYTPPFKFEISESSEHYIHSSEIMPQIGQQ